MSRYDPYASIAKRNFSNALMRLLLTEYGLAGGRRIARLLVEDVEKLIASHYPDLQHTACGTLVWTCTADEGRKAQTGKPTEEYKTVTIQLPLITPEDLEARTDRKLRPDEREKRQMVRLLKAADEQGGLLTIAELSVILNRGYSKIRAYIKSHHEETGELLPLKGYRMDQGASPTHKAQIVRLFEQGKEPPDIAHETRHSLHSVERYLKDYQRVVLLLNEHKSVAKISILIGRGESVVLQYLQIAQEFHPELTQC